MHKAQRGIFLLISNEFFKEARANGETLADRDGTGKDCHGLQELFKQLGFRPVVRMNQTADVRIVIYLCVCVCVCVCT